MTLEIVILHLGYSLFSQKHDIVAMLYPLIPRYVLLEMFIAFLELHSMLRHEVCSLPCDVLCLAHLFFLLVALPPTLLGSHSGCLMMICYLHIAPLAP